MKSKVALLLKDDYEIFQIMKEVTGKGKLVNNSLPKHLILNNRNILIKRPLPIASINICQCWT